MASFDLAADPDGLSRAAADAAGVGRREAFGVRQLAAALSLRPNNVSVPMFPISPMTGHATRFHPANRATEHTPVGCGEESPRSCRRVRRNTDDRERGRPRPHQRDDRPYDPFGSRMCGARTFTGWGCTNNVSVPISASEGYLHRLRQPSPRTRDSVQPMLQSGDNAQTTCLSLCLSSLSDTGVWRWERREPVGHYDTTCAARMFLSLLETDPLQAGQWTKYACWSG